MKKISSKDEEFDRQQLIDQPYCRFLLSTGLFNLSKTP